jgi:hypothetical protein
MGSNVAETLYNPRPPKHTADLTPPRNPKFELVERAWNYFKERHANQVDEVKRFDCDTLKKGPSEWEQRFRGMNGQKVVAHICLKGYTFWVRRMLTW